MTVALIACADRRQPNRLPTPNCPRCGTDESVISGDPYNAARLLSLSPMPELLPKRIPPVSLRYGLVAHVAD